MNVTTLQKIDYVYDTLFIEENYNKTLPSWTSKVYPEHMRDMRDLSFTMGTWNLELKRLKGGPLVQAILDHFKGFITGERRYKFVMFSGHDTTVATLLNTLGINSKIWVSCQIDFAKLSLFLHISCAFNQK